ncbi:MAG: 30S ribosome-binding factor RbfA [Marinomonas sp.]|jgi:ribosome-binding factor A|uniref:30S ribosome-binding factor RbfA n=1 Tax=unclassified Marinomonas TaxID=196814 RepID=UPI0005F9B69F|nr:MULTISPECIES: 30S ribosome-binding factor RbfA [unclassified Marinomonas]KJZ14758.1 ribosome-binding factor A [Marinomonas sp. S3726]KZM40887.1 ribosome-binding factor A [Marinomonas sp. SBI22]KZM42727.1 ribosome-binding factor A [Marinomonas sp. SBI8L]
MASEFSRTSRIGDQLQKELASIIQFEVKDPRLGIITINEVRVAKDLGYADIYYTVLGMDDKPEKLADSQTALDSASNFLRRRASQEIKLRVMPQLRFHYDDSVVNGAKMSALIDEAIKADAKHNPENDSE